MRGGTVVSIVTATGEAVCPRCELATSPFRRLKGLLGRRQLEADEGLLLRPASSVHTWFMRFPIDLVFLDKQLRVVRVAEDVRPWRMAYARRSRMVLELGAGAAAKRDLHVGDQLAIV